jgi:hypothetical protein
MNQPQLGLDSRDYYINSTINNRSDPETDARNKIVNFENDFSVKFIVKLFFRFEILI